MHTPLRRSARLMALLVAAAGGSHAAHAAPVTVSDPYQWLENRSTNSLGRLPGLRQNLGVNSAVPNGLAGTTATAAQGGTVFPLPFTGTTAIPNEFNTTVAADPLRYGAWQLTFNNGANTTTVNTPAIQPGLAPMPFVTDVRVTSVTGTSFSWNIPASASVDAVRVNLFDRGRLNLAGTAADIVYNATFGPTTTTFNLPTTLANGLPLILGNLYTLEINLLDFASNLPNANQADLRNRSRLYVDILPGPTTTSGAYLPVISPGVNGAAPLNIFNITSVPAGNLIYIAPALALGNIYKTGPGDPNFASVLLPAGVSASNQFKIVLADGQAFDATGGVPFTFASGGVSIFSVDGTASSLGIDPNNPRPFITGLSFTQPGPFSGSVQAVPEPAALALFAAGLLMMLLAVRRRVSQGH
jgi:hypothetical protein